MMSTHNISSVSESESFPYCYRSHTMSLLYTGKNSPVICPNGSYSWLFVSNNIVCFSIHYLWHWFLKQLGIVLLKKKCYSLWIPDSLHKTANHRTYMLTWQNISWGSRPDHDMIRTCQQRQQTFYETWICGTTYLYIYINSKILAVIDDDCL